MQMVRLAVRVVFRERPDLVRKVTSSYQRARQAEYRRRQEDEEALLDAAEPATPTPALVVANTEEVETEAA